ncbi:EamA domain-containing membrane protein RarD [Desulfotomaculum arcticum]|uniref:EamA domain-containing membrane protein RarD n=1 Tax=Desulfotruncus arcticus DSM 17038 TaxID=1121424 RepID=A0A1I2YWB9_9FIRM|nr:DMT family transporter [Desulfotruncus arcticus]SFH29902.1 EamA domain-containing membrane protein RarD [Desulfotomaculum arcticum] [Desulfotruncus arcticus DSM 17038]
MSQPKINPYLAVIIGVIAVSFGSILAKAADAPSLVIAFYRIGLTVLMLAPVTLATSWTELRSMSRRDVAMACLSGLMLALHFATWITSLNYTTIASSTVLVNMHPLFVITGGYLFYKERISPSGILGAALALAGCLVIGISDFRIGGQALYGDILAVIGAITVSGYMLVGRGLRNHLSLLPYIVIVYFVSSVALLMAVLAYGLPLSNYTPNTWLMFFLAALVPTIMGHTVFNWAFRYVKGAVVSVSILGEPVGATILAYFIFQQVPTFSQLAGGLIILVGLVIFIQSNARSQNSSAN